jgi:hypothetical protein
MVGVSVKAFIKLCHKVCPSHIPLVGIFSPLPPHAEGVVHTESDGAENSGNERKFHFRFAKVGQMREDLQGYVAWRRSS